MHRAHSKQVHLLVLIALFSLLIFSGCAGSTGVITPPPLTPEATPVVSGGQSVNPGAGVASAPSPTARASQVTAQAQGEVTLRSGPSNAMEVVGQLKDGQSALVIGRSAQYPWYLVMWTDAPLGQAWVYEDMVAIVGDINDLPIVEPAERPVDPGAGPTPTATPYVTVVPSGTNKVGVHLLLTDGSRPWPIEMWPSHLEYARQAVGEWGYVVQLVTSNDLRVKRWRTFMELCAEYHLTPIIRLATTFNLEANYWEMPPQDPDGTYRTTAAAYADFLSKLDWPTDKHYIVVGNEPNHGNEWSNQPNPAQYARFLIDVADAIHAADPNAKVMNAGFDSYAPNTNGLPAHDGFLYIDEESFMDGMIAAQPDVFSHIDLWASHPYPRGPFISGPWDQVFQIDMVNGATNPNHVDPPPLIPNRGINGYEWELFKLSTYGITDLPVMITETGWRHSETSFEGSRDEIPNITKAKFVADYVRYAYAGNDDPKSQDPHEGWTPWMDDPRVVGASIFALNGFIEAWGHTNLLILKRNGRVEGVYDILTEMSKLHGG